MARARRQIAKETGVKGARILVVEARYYDDIADMLLRGAKRVLKDAGAVFDIVTVPGALEIPTAIMIAMHGAEARERLRHAQRQLCHVGQVLARDQFGKAVHVAADQMTAKLVAHFQ